MLCFADIHYALRLILSQHYSVPHILNFLSTAATIAIIFRSAGKVLNNFIVTSQAFRHLLVLAAEPRLLMPREVHTGKYEYVSLEVTFKVSESYLLA